MMENKKANIFFLLMITFTSAMGGLLFGYDWVVIGGAKPFYELFFGIGNLPAMQGFVMGSAIIGCIVGVMVSGGLSDKYGRKPLMIAAAIVFIISAIGTGAVDSIVWFVVYRLIGGVAIGIASNVSPMYIAEVSPANVRGRYVSINQLTIVLGILAAQIVNWMLADPIAPGEDILNSWNGQIGWRWMFWAEAVPAIMFLGMIFIIPESPKWLYANSKMNESFANLKRIGGEDYAQAELKTLQASDSKLEGGIGLRNLFRGKMAKIITIGIVIAVFQQWCGINVIFNYAQEIFSSAGYGVSDILFNIVVTGVTNVVFTIVGMYTVDRLGRRALMIIGSAGLALVYLLLGGCYYLNLSGIPVLVLVVLAIACYAMSLAPVTWVVISEIFPIRVRGVAMAVSTFALWSACFVLTYTFPILNSTLGASGTFWLYGIICVIGFVFIRKNLPETKGKSLEQIEKELTK